MPLNPLYSCARLVPLPGGPDRHLPDASFPAPTGSIGRELRRIASTAVWRVVLTGHPFDIETLQEQFPKGDPRVVQDGDRYCLESADFDSLAPDCVALMARAKALLAQMNGAARLVHPSLQGVEAGRIVGPDAHEHVVVEVGSIVGRGKVSVVGVRTDAGPIPPPPPPAGQVALEAATGNADAGAALRLLGIGPLDWVNLYRILDCVRNAVGGLEGIVSRGLSTRAELNRFTGTANSQKAIGDDARHGPGREEPPKNPMTVNEARDLICRVVRGWLAP